MNIGEREKERTERLFLLFANNAAKWERRGEERRGERGEKECVEMGWIDFREHFDPLLVNKETSYLVSSWYGKTRYTL